MFHNHRAPDPVLNVLASPKGYSPLAIAEMFGYWIEGRFMESKAVEITEFMWGKELSHIEHFGLGATLALPAELSRQVPDMPTETCRTSPKGTAITSRPGKSGRSG